MKRKSLISALLTILCLLLLLSCGASDSYNTKSLDDFSAPREYEPRDSDEFGVAKPGDGGLTEDGADHAGGNDLAQRKIIKNVDLRIETKEFDRYLSEVYKTIEDCGGYIENSSITGKRYTSDSYRDARLVIRIPSGRLDSFRAGLSSLGNMIREEESIEDVTLRYIDVESRIDSLRTEYDALLALLEQPGSLSEVFSIQSRMTEVRASIESYESQKRKYDDLVSYSTVTMRIEEVERVSAPVGETIWEQIGNRFSENFYAVGRGARGLFIWVVGTSPYLVLIALLCLIAYLIVRFWDRKDTRAGKDKDEKKPPEDKTDQ